MFVIEKFNTSSFTATEYNGNCQIIDNLKIDGDSFQTFVRCEKEKFQLSYKITTEEEQQKLKAPLRTVYFCFCKYRNTFRQPQSKSIQLPNLFKEPKCTLYTSSK